jgi:hypothetical protein
MREMSVGGMFIETNEAISEGSKMRLRFHLDSCGSAVIATTEVRYTIDRLGLGVGFLAVSSTDRSRIETFVAQAGGSNFVNAPTVAAWNQAIREQKGSAREQPPAYGLRNLFQPFRYVVGRTTENPATPFLPSPLPLVRRWFEMY